ncbi:MAG: glycosyl transferase, group 1 family protein [Cyanobacteria bacterium RYN_339]|nr:glycosyl transferase, group 1 family protein [Cyanobacteria bacterium RYN_339]
MTSAGNIIFYLDRLGAGGVERITLNLLDGLTARGWHPTLVLNQGQGDLAAPDNVETIVLDARSFAGSVRALGSLVARRQPAVLVSQRAYLNLVSALALGPRPGGPRLVLTEHSLLTRWWTDARVPKRRADQVVRRALPLVYRRADALVAISHGIAADHARVLGRFDPKIRLLHNPIVAPTLLQRADEPLIGAPPTDLPWIVAVGRLDTEKNLGALLNAFAMLAPAARLVLVGDGPQRALLKERARELGVADRLHVVGFQTNPYAWIRRAAVLAMSSLFETFPTVLVEAMALGTPVVSFDCPEGPREIITNGTNGLLVRPEDPNHLARAIAAVLEDKTLALHLRRGGLVRAADFAYARTVPAYEALFEEMAARRRIAR